MKKWFFYFVLLFSCKGFCLESLEKAMDSVVFIARESRSSYGFILDYLWPAQSSYSHLSGFIIHAESNVAYVATAAHGLENVQYYEKFFVVMRSPDLKAYQAFVVGVDKPSDVAVLKIIRDDGEEFHSLSLEDPLKVKAGQSVFLFGNPFSTFLERSLTSGIVSAVNRNGLIFSGIKAPEGFIQFDAPNNPGCSGSPLLSEEGKVMGLNAWQYKRSQGAVGLSFAVSPYQIDHVARQLISSGKVVHGFLGVELDMQKESIFDVYFFVPDSGALVKSILKDSPAAKMGLEKHDVIVEINGYPVQSGFCLRNYLYPLEPKKNVDLTVYRRGEKIYLTVELESKEQYSKKIGLPFFSYGFVL